jgi:hypothetical protein
MVEKRKRANTAQLLANLERERKFKQALKNRENQGVVGRMVAGITGRLQAQNTAGMTRKEIRNAAAAKLALEEHRIKKRRLENARTNAERRAMMRQLNTRGTMVGGENIRKRITAEEKYKRMLGKVMRQATYTPTDFKQLGKIVKARRDRKWGDVERFIKEWETSVKRRVCRFKKKNMQNMARELNIPANRKKKSQLCKEIKNKM